MLLRRIAHDGCSQAAPQAAAFCNVPRAKIIRWLDNKTQKS